jgi:hypothetical protein
LDPIDKKNRLINEKYVRRNPKSRTSGLKNDSLSRKSSKSSLNKPPKFRINRRSRKGKKKFNTVKVSTLEQETKKYEYDKEDSLLEREMKKFYRNVNRTRNHSSGVRIRRGGSNSRTQVHKPWN